LSDERFGVMGEMMAIDLGAVSLTHLSILQEGFMPIFSATLSFGKSVSP